MATSDEAEKMAREDPQPGMSRFDRAFDAANGIDALGIRHSPDAASRMWVLAGRLTQRSSAIHAGDRTTAIMLLEAAHAIGEMNAALLRHGGER